MKWTTSTKSLLIGVLSFVVICLLDVGLAVLTNQSPKVPNSEEIVAEPARVPTNSNSQKIVLQDTSHAWLESLREEVMAQDNRASIVAREKERSISIIYKFATIEDATQDFLRQRGEAGIKQLVEAGFEKVSITAHTQDGALASREILLKEYLADTFQKKP